VQCAKQPYGSILCGFHVCEYLRTCSRFSSSRQQLKKAQGWWQREKVNQDFRQTVVDICKFVTESAHEGNMFFNKEGNLARIQSLRGSKAGALNYESRITFYHTSFPRKVDMYDSP
jgi:hypothetical protein